MRHFLALSLVAVLLIGLPAQAQDAASPTVPDSFETLTADWSSATFPTRKASYPESWSTLNLSQKANLPVIDLSRKQRTARKRWAGGGSSDELLRLFGPDNASVLPVGE